MTILVIIWEFLKSPVGRWIAGAGIILIIIGGIYVKGRHDGKLSYQAKVQREIAEAIQKGENGRASALKQLDSSGVPDGWFRD